MVKGYGTQSFSLLIWVLATIACGPRPGAKALPPSPHTGADAGGEYEGAETTTEDAAPVTSRRAAPTLGGSPTTAIEVCLPQGQTAYLARLRCDGDVPVVFERVRHEGFRNVRSGEEDYRLSTEQVRTRRPLADGERDLHPVDRYAIACPNSDGVRHLFLDMYHCEEGAQTVDAPPGYTLAPPSEQPASDAEK